MNLCKACPGLVAVFLFMTLFASNAAASWRSFHRAAGAGVDQKLALDSEGNVYVAGTVYQNSGSHITIVKYDSRGERLESYNYDSEAAHDVFLDIALTDEGKIYVVANQFTTNWNIVVFKLDSNGALLWEKQHEGFATAMAVDSMRNVIVGGSIDPEGGLRDSLLIKYQGDGTKLWERQFDGPYPPISSGRDVAVDKAGNVFLAGFGFTIAKFDGDGTPLWEKGYAGRDAYQVVLDDDGNAYVTGLSTNNALIVKLNPAGDEIWQVSHQQRGSGNATTEPCDIALDPQGNVFVATREKEKYELLKLGPDGTLLWNRKQSGKANTLFSRVAVDAQGFSWLLLTAPVSQRNDNVLISGYSAEGKRIAFARLNNGKSGRNLAADLLLDVEGNPVATFFGRQEGAPGWYTTKLSRTRRD